MYHSDDILQLAWDSILIKGWSADSKMGSLMDMYVIDHPSAELWLLRRFPRKWELTITARVFVARYIPKLSERLWDKKEVLFWLMMIGDRVNRQKCESDKIINKSDIAEIRKSIRADAKAKKTAIKIRELYLAHTPSGQWNVCK